MMDSGRIGERNDSASNLVATSATTTAPAMPQNRRRLAPFAIFFLRLAADAQPCVRQRVEPLAPDLLATLLALAELVGRLVQPPQGLGHVPEVAPLLRSDTDPLLALQGVRALIGHVEGVAREVAVGRLEARVEGLIVVAE